jgi:exodeoxyribonuclease-3
MTQYLAELKDAGRPVIWCGDLNVARTTKDIHQGKPKDTTDPAKLEAKLLNQHGPTPESPPSYKWMAGFTVEEREGFERILSSGYTDCWRELHPDAEFTGYTWWNPKIRAFRPADRGWRIDYCIIDAAHRHRLVACETMPHIGTRTKRDPSIDKYGSDHGVLSMTLRIEDE